MKSLLPLLLRLLLLLVSTPALRAGVLLQEGGAVLGVPLALRASVLLLRADMLLLRASVLLLRAGVLLLRAGVLLLRAGALLLRREGGAADFKFVVATVEAPAAGVLVPASSKMTEPSVTSLPFLPAPAEDQLGSNRPFSLRGAGRWSSFIHNARKASSLPLLPTPTKTPLVSNLPLLS